MQMGEWAQRRVASNARQNGIGSHDATSPRAARITVGSRRETAGRLGMAHRNAQRPRRAFELAEAPCEGVRGDDGRAAKRNEKPTRPFVLYSLRHTFLTRLGQSGCDVWTLARIGWARLDNNFVALRSPFRRTLFWTRFLGWVGTELGTMRMRLPSCRLRKTQQPQYSELVTNGAPVAQLDRASAF
jgi:hypothetical protein